jgi:hypothetical protein
MYLIKENSLEYLITPYMKFLPTQGQPLNARLLLSGFGFLFANLKPTWSSKGKIGKSYIRLQLAI